MLKRIFFRSFYFILIFLTATVAQAQGDCPVIVDEALLRVGDNCGGIERNSACYGASLVKSTPITVPMPPDFFVTPGDRAQLIEFREIQPQPLNEEDHTFGVAVLNVQADVPGTLPGQAVILLLAGDTRVINEVAPDNTEKTPFQSFYFLPGTGKANCYEAEPLLTIQTPDNITINIVLNGVDTEMMPGTVLTLTPSVCTVHRGTAILRAGAKETALSTNQTLDVFIDDQGRIIGQPPIRAISQNEFIRGEQVQETLNALAETNGWDKHTLPIPVIFAPEPVVQSSCAVQHTVQLGESLEVIAQQYAASMAEINAANRINDPLLILPGQVLCIPNAGSGFVPLSAGG